MSDDRKYCTPEFVFGKVFTWPYSIIYLVVIIGAIPAVLIYLLFISRFFSHGGLAISFGVMIITASLIMKALAKPVRVYFDEKSILISDTKGDFKRFLKRDIAGIYCYDYENKDKPNVSVTIILTNGKKLHFNDINLFGRTDLEKAQMLKRFLIAAKNRLDLNYVRTDRWRSLWGVGANWYAVSPPAYQ